ncbi:hypothetical protein L9F63_010839, partial [Diploptera punctata]
MESDEGTIKYRYSNMLNACIAKIKLLTEKKELSLIKESNEPEESEASTEKSYAKERQKESFSQREPCILAQVRRNPTIEDDVVLIFLGIMMRYVTESYSEKRHLEIDIAPSTPSLHTDSENDSSQKLDENNIESKSTTDSSFKKIFSPKECDLPSLLSYPEIEHTNSKLRIRRESSLITVLEAKIHDDFTRRKQSRMKRKSLREYTENISRVSRVIEETLSMLNDYLNESHQSGIPVLKTIENIDEAMEIEQEVINWRVSYHDQDVSITFIEGNTYEGHISRMLMEGCGKYNWTDGSSYKGNFEDGKINGQGKMTFSDLSWYEGEFYHGIRHGKGHFVAIDGIFSYYGDWYLGQKHGKGIIFYGNEHNDYYYGDFFHDERHGYGSRQYRSGARYFGEWKSGQRHGFGTMVFPNNDVYTGSWENGLMNGEGEYIWRAFVNNKFVQPTGNIFRGHWVNGLRSGKGTLLRACGGNIFGKWVDNKKHGPGMVVCWDGLIIRGNPLFIDDNLDESPDENFMIYPSFIIPFSKSNIKEICPENLSTKRNRKSLSRSRSVSIVTETSRPLCASLTYKKVTRSQILHRSEGNPRKINLHDSNFELSYYMYQLLELMDKTPHISKISQSYSNIVTKHKDVTSKNIEISNRGKSSKICTEKYYSQMKDISSLSDDEEPYFTEDMVFATEDMIENEENEEQSMIIDDEMAIKETSITSYMKKTTYNHDKIKLIDFEKKWLKKIILLNIYDLRNIYQKYSRIACKEPVEYDVKCLRIMVWQFERDCGFNHRGFSLIEVDQRV